MTFESGDLLNYAYKLEGFDKDWINAGNNKRVAYFNLPSGKYTFKVRVRMLNGEWGLNELKKEIVIHPAPWAAPWAIALYWLAGIGLTVLAIRLIIRWRTQEERLALAERQKEINQAHIDFVTNISHEVRTPLAMVYAPLKELAKEDNLNEHERNLVDTMQRNAERLMKLVKQLLDTGTGEKDEKAGAAHAGRHTCKTLFVHVKRVEAARRAHERTDRKGLAARTCAEVANHLAAARTKEASDQLTAFVLHVYEPILINGPARETGFGRQSNAVRAIGCGIGLNAVGMKRLENVLAIGLEEINAKIQRRPFHHGGI